MPYVRYKSLFSSRLVRQHQVHHIPSIQSLVVAWCSTHFRSFQSFVSTSLLSSHFVMKTTAVLALLGAITASAAPLEKRQFGGGSTSNELQQGDCRAVTFIFARGSTEPGNMVGFAAISGSIASPLTPCRVRLLVQPPAPL